ncbi:hypothetical protein [Enterococcus faecium]|uniref:hypothetical protein n=1 Tax=Enterococcus TaxID=1350 RepID=UPI001912962A|nr:hypothetical protein [Enterococcus faecium]MBK5028407.1 hypothetical protein [Enterococcus faecium]MBK5039047.1 hypothetical protein [Enterococcus faecium]MBK5044121.1 hypothetical protein [Enterococcus faecium]MBK5068894.1 hypothetical protein [Enterococcus faecium]MBK5132267.1 hypothetical protein [Enterococcus faecium]
MYLLPISYIIIGFIFFVGSIALFLMDYKTVLMNKGKKSYLFLNVSSIILSLLLFLLGIIYVVIINNQL